MGIYYNVESLKDISKIRYLVETVDGERIPKITIHTPNINDVKDIIHYASFHDNPIFQVWTEYSTTLEESTTLEDSTTLEESTTLDYIWIDIPIETIRGFAI